MLTGTVVEHKRGKFLYDLAQHGDKILVARGGQGGISLLEMSEHKKKKMMNMTSNVMTDENDKIEKSNLVIKELVKEKDEEKKG
ncbi:putative GTP1/OBG domain superfamily protein [Helianthus annuus]|uniref:GTP1/OBG domain superfamily protein n=1 Tax=Helianthus annuus TaxID=4232 RepID=A0A251UZK5_HELAN|nr:putative GTP1/OBG domain superfamily protein [Helianthus annuus]KAJ0448073.1 putative GTP1/OBG domain superfamily protein [Helianthus annuus]KAJ0520568.1 putative GTP1/OBG domain superfamily protein [Helianthus annuus]KAJ0526188.1 putative GTP1/OBG domain superfamily protein [Helianthus annuus]KAJ0542582.1 putative GTP1/OBG domain superfamily protein [Helianthus annuus]